jgi:FkbM family methyltransferase
MTSEFARFLKDDMYTHYLDNLVTTPNSVTLDIGSYTGDSLIALSSRVQGTIHGFEPIRSFWKKAEERTIHYPNVRVHNVGLGAEDEVKILNLQYDGTSEFLHSSKTEQCIFRSFFNVWNSLGLSQIDVLHMNVEGGEYAIFANLIRQGLLPKIKTLIVQFHYPDKFMRTRLEIQEELRKTHDCVYDYSFVWERWDLRKEFTEVTEHTLN